MRDSYLRDELQRSTNLPTVSAWRGQVPRKGMLAKRILLLLLAALWPAARAYGQSQSQSSSQQSPPAQQSPSPAQSQSSRQSQSQPHALEKEESVADAARTAKARKPRPDPGKVYTEEDLSGMQKGGVSVVGEENRATARGAGIRDPGGDYHSNGEKYWRGRARELLDKMAAIDQEIAKLKDDIKKYGNGGFDITSGMKNNVAYIEDRDGQVKELQKRKAGLEQKMDLLEEEGRKAGASPAWFR